MLPATVLRGETSAAALLAAHSTGTMLTSGSDVARLLAISSPPQRQPSTLAELLPPSLVLPATTLPLALDRPEPFQAQVGGWAFTGCLACDRRVTDVWPGAGWAADLHLLPGDRILSSGLTIAEEVGSY